MLHVDYIDANYVNLHQFLKMLNVPRLAESSALLGFHLQKLPTYLSTDIHVKLTVIQKSVYSLIVQGTASIVWKLLMKSDASNLEQQESALWSWTGDSQRMSLLDGWLSSLILCTWASMSCNSDSSSLDDSMLGQGLRGSDCITQGRLVIGGS